MKIKFSVTLIFVFILSFIHTSYSQSDKDNLITKINNLLKEVEGKTFTSYTDKEFSVYNFLNERVYISCNNLCIYSKYDKFISVLFI